MTKLEQAAKAMYQSIEWNGITTGRWERERLGLRQHYIAQAAAALGTLKSNDSVWNAGIDAILNEKQE